MNPIIDKAPPGRSASVAALVAAVALLAALVTGCGTAAARTPPGCAPPERAASLAADQQRVLALLGDLRVLRGDGDLKRLATLNPARRIGYPFPAHMFVSMGGVGFTMMQLDPRTRPGLPSLLFYRPNPAARNVLDPFGKDYPYTLAGWGYGGAYTPGVPPSFPSDPGLRCLTPGEWFVHERSVHPSDNWQNLVVPPAEQWHGQAAGTDPPRPQECARCTGAPHGRVWDTHIWLGPDPRVPQVSMFAPGPPIPGFDPVAGVGFFHPDPPPSGS